MELSIIYRCNNREVDKPVHVRNVRPPWFCKKKCFSSLVRSVEKYRNLIDKFYVLHDGEEGSLYEHIKEYKKCEIIKTNTPNILDGIVESYEFADTLQNKNIYIVEDDYLHLENSIHTIFYGTLHYGLVTGYDHPDHYKEQNDDITDGKDFVRFLSSTNCHWRTVESTCATVSCCHNLWDVVSDYAKKYVHDRETFRRLYNEKNIRLWSCIPGVCTHLNECMSPGIDWDIVASENKK